MPVISAKELLINDDIRAKEVRLLDEQGEQMGIKSLAQAKDYAYERGVDLVCIAPQATPPVCRAMDYGKFRYEQDKRAKEQKKKQQPVEVMEVQLSCRIDKHDFDTKVNQSNKWLTAGMKVKIDMRFRGRLITRQEVGMKIMNDFIAALSEVSNVEKKPSLEGNIMSCVLAPKKK